MGVTLQLVGEVLDDCEKIIGMEVTEGDDTSTFNKIVMVGNPGVGKTAFLLRYCGCGFSPFLSSTMGVDYRERVVYR